jgi:hypothetical protein
MVGISTWTGTRILAGSGSEGKAKREVIQEPRSSGDQGKRQDGGALLQRGRLELGAGGGQPIISAQTLKTFEIEIQAGESAGNHAM